MPSKDKVISWIEIAVVTAMQALLILIVVAATIVLFVLFFKRLIPVASQIESAEGLLVTVQRSFAGVLTVILGLELLETLNTYFVERHVRLEVILIVAIIAVARHILQVDFENTPGTVLLGISAVILALGAGYFLVKKSHTTSTVPDGTQRGVEA
jgi:uncharacterized membrane protein (DUF373 family)